MIKLKKRKENLEKNNNAESNLLREYALAAVFNTRPTLTLTAE